ncbi:MAG: helix-turn-helix domain-containing protein [Azospirillaceae bacterium]
MPGRDGYRQYCPIAIAAEVMGERWTPLVIRGLFCGASRFNDIQRSVPRMSSSLLSRRLRELEEAGVIAHHEAPGATGARYALTPAGEALFPVLEQMGVWAQTHLRPEILESRNLDPDLLMWEIRHAAIDRGAAADAPDPDARPPTRRVACFRLDGVPVAKRFYWLVFEAGDVDICLRDPGHPVDLHVHAHIRDLVAVWLGHERLETAREDGRLRLEGARGEIAAFTRWFALSHFARVPPGLAAE